MTRRSAALLPVWLLVVLACSSAGSRSVERIPPFEDYVKAPATDYLEFLAVGDAGTGTADQYAVGAAMAAHARSNPVAFVLYLGDNFYEAGVGSVSDPQWSSKFEEVYDPAVLDVPFYPILGNHDYAGDEQAQVDYVSPNGDRWDMPSRYYAITRVLPDTTQVDLFFIDTVSFDETQRQWLASGLAASTARWKLVMGHHPVYSNGYHGGTPALLTDLAPLLDGVADAYLAGHEHDLELLEPVNGVSYVVDGAGGKQRASGVGANTIFAVGRLGFMDFLVSHQDLVCRVFDAEGTLLYSRVLKSKSP